MTEPLKELCNQRKQMLSGECHSCALAVRLSCLNLHLVQCVREITVYGVMDSSQISNLQNTSVKVGFIANNSNRNMEPHINTI